MSAIEASPVEIECILSESDTYIETLTVKRIEAQPWLTELVIKTQLSTAKNPEEKRVKARSFIERTRLAEIHGAIGEFLQCPSSSDEPMLS